MLRLYRPTNQGTTNVGRYVAIHKRVASRIIVVNHPTARSDYDPQNMDVYLKLEWYIGGLRDPIDGFEYLDTPVGSFRRHDCYWRGSPYGWSAVSWG